jgi:type IV fimbrial biogenesis protein FimT
MSIAGAGRVVAGWTTLELLVTASIVALLASLAIPQFREIAADARRSDRLYAMVRSLHSARSAAILRAQPVVVCRSPDGQQCLGPASPGQSWSEGWIVFANADRRMPPRVDPGDEILYRDPARHPRLRITANRAALVYWPISLGGTTASIVFCDERGSRAARAVIVSHTGRVRISNRGASGARLECSA